MTPYRTALAVVTAALWAAPGIAQNHPSSPVFENGDTIEVQPSEEGHVAVPEYAVVPDGESIVIQIMYPMF